jgi:hypothetical protein
MFKNAAYAALAVTAFAATPAMAATLVHYNAPTPDAGADGDGDINLTYAGPGARSSALSVVRTFGATRGVD